MKIGFISLGCPKNLVDGEVMLGIARDAGHELTSDPSDADVLVVNTCAFIDNAKQESIDAILEMAQHKKDGHCSRLVVTGCLAERYRDELRKEIPEIDAVLGTGEVPDILDAIGARDSGVAVRDSAQPVTFFRSSGAFAEPRTANRESRTAGRQPLPTYIYDADTPRLLTTPRHFAYVKIAEGCDYTCAFCIIPTLRGGYRSRTTDSIVREARALAARGVRELLLISQDTTFYGIDRGERGALARLLRELNAIDGLAWIRLLYLYPTTITDDVLAAMAECDKVCRYIDLPLQHASADVLKRMRRPGNRKTYDALLARIRDRVPGVTLRTRHGLRPHRRVHLLARGRHARPRGEGRRAGCDETKAPGSDHGAAATDRRRATAGAHRKRGRGAGRRSVGGARARPSRTARGTGAGYRPRGVPDGLRPLPLRTR